jgi:hypothetical protein
MDRITQYAEIIKEVISDYAQLGKPENGIEYELIFDNEHNHYQLFKVGWTENLFRVCSIALHFDIKDGKIWLQHSAFEADIAAELVEKGVPKSDIVLGFFAPYRRKLSEYAAA